MRAPLVAAIVALAAWTACSSGTQPVHPATDPGRGSANGSSTPPAHVSEADCTNLITHALELRLAEAPPGSAQLGDAEQAQVRDQVRAAVGDDCHKLTPAQVTCGMTATTLDAYAACDPR